MSTVTGPQWNTPATPYKQYSQAVFTRVYNGNPSVPNVSQTFPSQGQGYPLGQSANTG